MNIVHTLPVHATRTKNRSAPTKPPHSGATLSMKGQRAQGGYSTVGTSDDGEYGVDSGRVFASWQTSLVKHGVYWHYEGVQHKTDDRAEPQTPTAKVVDIDDVTYRALISSGELARCKRGFGYETRLLLYCPTSWNPSTARSCCLYHHVLLVTLSYLNSNRCHWGVLFCIV